MLTAPGPNLGTGAMSMNEDPIFMEFWFRIREGAPPPSKNRKFNTLVNK